MTIEQAIKKAIEGGYEIYNLKIGDEKVDIKTDTEILLSPAFWQCLGKAMGWKKYQEEIRGDTDSKDNVALEYPESWKYHWHRFIDHLIAGNTIESFFEQL